MHTQEVSDDPPFIKIQDKEKERKREFMKSIIYTTKKLLRNR